MNTLTITIGILAPVITFLIGRYFRAVKAKELVVLTNYGNYYRDLYSDLMKRFGKIEVAFLAYQKAAPKFQLVPNKDKHPAANDNYLYIEGEIKGKREAGLLKLSDWSEAKERLLKNPEDKLNNQ